MLGNIWSGQWKQRPNSRRGLTPNGGGEKQGNPTPKWPKKSFRLRIYFINCPDMMFIYRSPSDFLDICDKFAKAYQAYHGGKKDQTQPHRVFSWVVTFSFFSTVVQLQSWSYDHQHSWSISSSNTPASSFWCVKIVPFTNKKPNQKADFFVYIFGRSRS